MIRRAAILAATLLVSPIALACGESASDERDAGARATRGPAPEVERAGPVVATVDGAPITLGEVEEVATATGLSPLDALRRLEEERVLAAHAEAAASAADDDEARDAARRAAVQALLEERIEREVDAASIPEERVEARIREQARRFARPERRRTAHLLARVEDGAPESAWAEAETFVRRAIARLRAAEDPIADARAYEGHEGAGFRATFEELPLVARDGTLVPEYVAATFAAPEPGVLPEPVRTRFGWHAILLREIAPAWQAPRDEVEAVVREELAIEERAARLEALVRELSSRTPVVIDAEAAERALGEGFGEGGEEAAP